MQISTPQDPNSLSLNVGASVSGAQIAASMAPVRSDSGAPAAHTQTAHVRPLGKSNFSTQGRAMTWDNVVPGKGSFMEFPDDNSRPQMPQSMG